MRKDEKDPRNKKLIRAKMNYYSLPEGWVLWNSPLSIVLVNINWRFPPFRIIFVSVTIFINVPVLVFSFHTSFDNTWKKMRSVNYGTNRGWNCCACQNTNVEIGREREREREKQRYLRLNFILRVDTICDKHVYMYIYIFRVLNHDL